MTPKFKAYLQLARISNLPTVFSNVLVGAAMVPWFPPFPWIDAVYAMVVVSFLYIGGMSLNDLFDRNIDAIERPGRPLPSGTLSILEASLFTTVCILAALATVMFLVPDATSATLALLVFIVAYNALHKRWAGSVLFMGLCRATIYVVAAHAVQVESKPLYIIEVALYGLLLAAYIIVLTVVARKEASGALGARKWLVFVLFAIPALPLLRPVFSPEWTIPIACILFCWLIRSARFIWQSPPKVVPAVLGWLAGISLLDAFFLTFTPFPWLSLVAIACFAVTVWGHRRIAGT